MEPYQIRVISEAEELEVKLTTLKNYLMTPHSHNLKEEVQKLMHSQKFFMQGYLDTLKERIKLF